MIVLPVTWATASMTWPISTSRKLGVMRWPLLWALTTPVAVIAAISTSSAIRCAEPRITFNTPALRLGLTVILFICSFLLFVPGLWLGRRRLVHGDHAIPAVAELFGFTRDLCQVEHQFLLAPVSRDTDSRIGRRIERGEDFLGAILVVQRGSIDRGHEVTGAQADTGESLAIGAWIYPKAAHLAAGEHRLRPQDLADDAGIVVHQLAHALQHGVIARGCHRWWGWRLGRHGSRASAWQHHGLERATAIDDGAIVVNRVQQSAAGYLLADGDHLGCHSTFSNDCHTFLGVVGGQHAGQHQGHAGGGGIGGIAVRVLDDSIAEQVGIDESPDVQGRGGRR